GFGNCQEIWKVEGGMPAGIVLTVAGDRDLRSSLPQAVDSLQCTLHLGFISNDANKLLHHLLKLELNLIRSLRDRVCLICSVERLYSPARCFFDLRAFDLTGTVFARELRGELTGALPEHQQIRQRVTTEPICSVNAGCAFTRRKQTGHASHLSI